jgi:hypothetical protein
MNILVLTPDRVGSSLLQKYITTTMQMYDYGKPVINLHELTNGIEKYHSTTYNQEVVGKPDPDIWSSANTWGYYQTLEEVVQMLGSVDHYKVSRLAQYHLINRKDKLEDLLSFYQYINDNFYIISAQRTNLFEHALSWCVVAFTKELNIYDHQEKIKIFQTLYKKKITIDQTVFENYLDKYLVYLEWVDSHFRVNSIFNYDKDVHNLEKYVNGLDIFPEDQPIKTWKEHYGISWNDWNSCHYLISDTSGFSKSISQDAPIQLLNGPENTALPTTAMTIEKLMSRTSLSTTHQEFLKGNIQNYVKAYADIGKLVINRTLIHGMPIKLQTLAEKAILVKNFEECIDTYNNWSIKNSRKHQVSLNDLGVTALDEIKAWYRAS